MGSAQSHVSEVVVTAIVVAGAAAVYSYKPSSSQAPSEPNPEPESTSSAEKKKNKKKKNKKRTSEKMNAEAIRSRIVGTLSADANVRRQAELELKSVCNASSFCSLPGSVYSNTSIILARLFPCPLCPLCPALPCPSPSAIPTGQSSKTGKQTILFPL